MIDIHKEDVDIKLNSFEEDFDELLRENFHGVFNNHSSFLYSKDLDKLLRKNFHGVFNNHSSFLYSYAKIFRSFASLVKEHCFIGCFYILNYELGLQTQRLLWTHKNREFYSLLAANKYFSISNFYASIYREMDYEFFVCFDQYLNRYSLSDPICVKYRLDAIRFTDVFDNKRFCLNSDNSIHYDCGSLGKYDVISRSGFFSTDGLRLLVSFKNEGDSDKIFSYLLSKYRFEFHDMLRLLEAIVKRRNLNCLEILLSKYNFFDQKNCLSQSFKHFSYVKTSVQNMLYNNFNDVDDINSNCFLDYIDIILKSFDLPEIPRFVRSNK